MGHRRSGCIAALLLGSLLLPALGCSTASPRAKDLGVVSERFGSRIVRDAGEARDLLVRMTANPPAHWVDPQLPPTEEVMRQVDFGRQVLVLTEFPTTCGRLLLKGLTVDGDKAVFHFERRQPGPYVCFATTVPETHVLAVDSSALTGVKVVEGDVSTPGL